MEIASIFVVNKADRGGADQMAREIRAMLQLGPAGGRAWEPPVLLTQAHKGEGIQQLAQAVLQHRQAQGASGELERKRQQRRAAEFFRTVEERISAGLHRLVASNGDLQSFVERIRRGEIDPYSAAVEVLQDRALLHKWFTAMEGERRGLPAVRASRAR